ncbi:hypothetical protein EJ08DRAFT_650194 [Tothia fuscella]|uniref:Uncharacterized protein n=1 Tax=Tothia fuscella TaxID=1048955 RepID=A0A9P4NQS0_9PEZI|nr:hypothetical protein EJ08DRAFT_650194 [Tothia fuscella]
MSRAQQLPAILLLIVAQYVFPTQAMDRVLCNREIVEKLNNKTLLPIDAIFFRQFGQPMNDPTNIGLTLNGCRAQCGAEFDWYRDVGPRLSTWLIPVIVLLGNMQLATLGKRNSLMTLLHLLGDPIDSCWSLLTKLEIWNRCYDQAVQLSRNHGQNEDHVRDRGTILAAIQELEGPGSNPMQTYNEIIGGSTIDGDDPERPALHHLCREIANELSDSNSLQLPRTWLAILSYVVTVLSAFVEAIGGKPSSQPGGRIGTAMFMSWLLPIVLLSNTVGCFTSRRTCLRVMERFAKATKPIRRSSFSSPEFTRFPPEYNRSPGAGSTKSPGLSPPPAHHRANSINTVISSAPPPPPALSLPDASLPSPAENHRQDYFHQTSPSKSAALRPHSQSLSVSSPGSTGRRSVDYLDLQLFSQERPSKIMGHLKSYTPFSKAQPWFGAIYTFQAVKFPIRVKGNGRSPYFLMFLASLPIWISLITAFLEIWYTPTIGLTCRHFPPMAITLAWICSAALTETSSHFLTGIYHWRFVILKDTFIALPALGLIFLSSSGLFNSCWCWSSIYSRGLANALILVDPDPIRKRNAETIYPGLVASCLFLQASVFLIMISLSKRGRSLLRRVEKIKEEDFWKLHHFGGRVYEGEGGKSRAGSEGVPFLAK